MGLMTGSVNVPQTIELLCSRGTISATRPIVEMFQQRQERRGRSLCLPYLAKANTSNQQKWRSGNP